jgi:uncharacterized phiE125 gp8 family phage protein
MAGLVTLTDVKQFLNITTAVNDDELQGFLLDAVSVIEDIIGPIGAKSVTEVVAARGPLIVLPQIPVLSVQSVSVQSWQGSTAVDDTASWRLDARTGLLHRQVIGAPLIFLTADAVITVTYTIGRTDVPNPINRAVLIQVADMWRTQRGATSLSPGGDQAPASFSGPGFLAPAVMELLLPYLLPPGVG